MSLLHRLPPGFALPDVVVTTETLELRAIEQEEASSCTRE
jgi:hypothetical protein